MLKTTLRGILAHKIRLVSTLVAVLLGVAFVAGSLVLTDTIANTFDKLFADVNARTDAVVRQGEAFSDDFESQRGRVDASLLTTVEQADGVAAAEGQVGGYAQF